MTAVTDRTGATDAPAPSSAEQAEIQRFGIFEAEETVEKVARAMWETAHARFTSMVATWESTGEWVRQHYRALAAAAIAAMAVSRAEEAVRPGPATVALAWHDAVCPEADDCRDRPLHAASQTIVNAGVVGKFLDRLSALAAPKTGGGQ